MDKGERAIQTNKSVPFFLLVTTKPPNVYTGPAALVKMPIRKADLVGVVFDMLGIILIILGIWSIIKPFFLSINSV